MPSIISISQIWWVIFKDTAVVTNDSSLPVFDFVYLNHIWIRYDPIGLALW